MASDVASADARWLGRAIHVRGAVKSFSGRVVVDVDDLVLGEHPIEGLIGPNGAGKTTLMRMVMHSLPARPRHGDAAHAGRARGRPLLPADAPHGAARRREVQPGDHGLRQADHLGFPPPGRGRVTLRAALARPRRGHGLPAPRGGDAPLPRRVRLRRPHDVRALGRREEAARHRALPAPATDASSCSTSRPPACPTT